MMVVVVVLNIPRQYLYCRPKQPSDVDVVVG